MRVDTCSGELHARFWALDAFSQENAMSSIIEAGRIVMHLMALGAFPLAHSKTSPSTGSGSLNAPYGARCLLTRRSLHLLTRYTLGVLMRLMALVAFLQMSFTPKNSKLRGLNPPYGARCFLTENHRRLRPSPVAVIMHLMALGAFSQTTIGTTRTKRGGCLNAPYGARCFLTENTSHGYSTAPSRHNAPYGARCFLTGRRNHRAGNV